MKHLLTYDPDIPLLGANSNACMCCTCSPKDIFKSTIWGSPHRNFECSSAVGWIVWYIHILWYPIAMRLRDLPVNKQQYEWIPKYNIGWQKPDTNEYTLYDSVQSLSCVWLFAAPWKAARQASLSTNNSQSLLKLMSIKSVMPFNYLSLCCPLLLLPSIFPSISEPVLHIRWPKCWSFRFSISPSNEYSGLTSFRIDCLDLLAVQGTQESSPAPQFKSINSSVLNFPYSPTLVSIHDYWKNHSLD